MFPMATLWSPEKLPTQPDKMTDTPRMIMETLINRTVSDPSCRKVFAEIYAIAIVAPVQKIRLRMRRRYGGLKTADSETPKITVAAIEAISMTTGIGDSF
jgi:hypothetical protein